MGHYPETDSHIKDKIKVVLDLVNYATNILAGLNHLKAKVDGLNVGELKKN